MTTISVKMKVQINNPYSQEQEEEQIDCECEKLCKVLSPYSIWKLLRYFVIAFV